MNEGTGLPTAHRNSAAAFSVRDLLDAELSSARRMANLQDLCARFTGQPLEATVASLHEALADRIDMEDYRRLHILISHLYHQCGASIPATAELCAEVNRAFGRRGDPAPTSPGGR